MHASREMRDCEADLAGLLNDLSSVQEELLEVLVQKRDRMAASDLEGMAELGPREEQLCQRLQVCHQRRRELLESSARSGANIDSLEKLASLTTSGNQEKLRKQVKDAAARMRLLKHHSLTNWVLAQRTLLHLSQLLEILATGGQLQPTYGKGESVTPRGALVDREA
jgi:flagellar biosynthesis/type III secretory pathway chaperone